jgi:hypothetical protein
MGTHKSEQKAIALPQRFEEFKKYASDTLKNRKKNWTEELALIKRTKLHASEKRKFSSNSRAGRKKMNGEKFTKSTFGRYYSELRSWDILPENKQELLTLFFNDLMVQAAKAWKITINEDGTFQALQDNRNRYLHASHYLCYYWLHDNYGEKKHHGIAISYFSFHYNDKQYPQFAWMEFFEQPKNDPSNNTPELSTTLVTTPEDISYFSQSMIVRMEGLDNSEIKAQFTFSMNQKMSMGKDLPKNIKGAYSTVAHMSATGEPMAGLLYLKKVTSLEEAMENINDPDHQVPDEVYHFLFGTKLAIGPPEKVQKTSYSIQQETNELKDYAGVYLGHILSRSKLDNPLLESIAVEVFSNTRAVIHVPDLDKSENKTRKYHGRIRLVRQFNNNLIGSFDISSDYRVSRFTVYIFSRLKEHSHSREPQYYGVYAGVDYSSERLVAGRIRLTKKSKSPLNEEEITTLVKAELLNETSLSNDTDLVQLFSGMDPQFDFVDTLMNKNRNGLPVVNHTSSRNFPYSGKYHIYELSHNQTHINRIPVEILSDGSFVMQTGRSDNKQHIVLGSAHYKTEKFLSLTGFDADSNFPVSHHLFSVQAYDKKEVQHAFGVSTQVSPDNNPSAHIKILVPVSSGSKKGWVAIKIGGTEFNQEDEILKGLLTWLGGRYDRLFKAPGIPNKIYSSRMMHQEDFVNIHFYAACYQANQKNIDSTVSHLYQAFLHGFNNIQLLEIETRETGALYPLLDKGAVIKELQSEPGSPFRKIGELVQQIRERHEPKDPAPEKTLKPRSKKR